MITRDKHLQKAVSAGGDLQQMQHYLSHLETVLSALNTTRSPNLEYVREGYLSAFTDIEEGWDAKLQRAEAICRILARDTVCGSLARTLETIFIDFQSMREQNLVAAKHFGAALSELA